jgi:hypothetical protein
LNVQIHADRRRAWTAPAFTGSRILVVCSVLVVALVVSGDVALAEAVLGMASLGVFLTLASGVLLASWWWIRPGRVSYVVAEGQLRVCRGRRVVRRHPCADITSLSLTGDLGWRDLTVRNWFTYGIGGWPELRVDRHHWPTPRMLIGPRTQPAILLWGQDRCAKAEEALRQAVTAHGAVLSDET